MNRSMKILHRLERWLMPLTHAEKQEIVSDIHNTASPGFDFFLLVVLSCSIATLGLITNSAAVIIGAMLLAPLMSPIIGFGLASLTGDSKLIASSLSALIRGALLAILLAFLVTSINDVLPIVSLQELPQEILSRTRPTPIDLAIALAGGMAAAYALTRPNLSAALPGVAIATALMPPLCTIGIGIALNRLDVAGGAALLFITNTIAIAFASVLVFFVRGFGATDNHRLPRGLLLSALLTAVLLVPLTYYSVRFFQQAAENRFIQDVVQQQVSDLENVQLVGMNLGRNDSTLNIVLTIQTNSPMQYQQVVALQASIVKELNRPVSLIVNQVLAEQLNPLIPPTATTTPTVTSTVTPGPSLTPSNTPTVLPTNTITPTATITLTFTPTSTNTPTPTTTPQQGLVVSVRSPQMVIYQEPGGPMIGYLYAGQKLTILQESVVYQGLVWVQVLDSEGRVGWVPQIFIMVITLTPTATPSSTPTLLISITPEGSVYTVTPSTPHPEISITP
jgi:uncharacterized hydrophobic protein (TIGR00271 family)